MTTVVGSNGVSRAVGSGRKYDLYISISIIIEEARGLTIGRYRKYMIVVSCLEAVDVVLDR